MRRLTLFFILLGAGALTAQNAAPFNDSIRLAELKADLFFLAGDGFKGRLVGTPENALAADWVRSRFERAGLKPGAPNGSFIQTTHLMVATLGTGSALTASLPGGAKLHLKPEQDFYPQRFSASGSVTAPVVYAGFGIHAPKLDYDDYGDRVKGRIALILEHEPGERDPKSPFDGVVTAEVAVAIRKAMAAEAQGAVGVLFVTDVHNHPAPANFEAAARNFWPAQAPRIDRFTLASWADRVRIPVGQISPALAETLVRGTGRSLLDLSRAAETARGFGGVPLEGVEVTLTTAVHRHIVPDRNVLAFVEGADPKLKDEVVIISAHYDHEGADGNVIYSGADDDGSGTVALIEIADAYAMAAAAGQRPRRSVLFAAWGSEERGPLLGAWAYTEDPTFPLERTVAVLNMDMIGRNEEVQVGGGPRFNGLEVQTAESNRNAVNILGYSRHPELSATVERANRSAVGIGLELKMRYDNNSSNLLRRSDQWPFLQMGVPAVWFHTGLHPDYHTQYDRPEKINYEKLERVARLVHQTSWVLANQDGRPK
ncbi:MAG: M28 family peptidase [Acidobacteriota bacterium]|nr:M28 family peptidase [Acidobacteriota bacterium]